MIALGVFGEERITSEQFDFLFEYLVDASLEDGLVMDVVAEVVLLVVTAAGVDGGADLGDFASFDPCGFGGTKEALNELVGVGKKEINLGLVKFVLGFVDLGLTLGGELRVAVGVLSDDILVGSAGEIGGEEEEEQ